MIVSFNFDPAKEILKISSYPLAVEHGVVVITVGSQSRQSQIESYE